MVQGKTRDTGMENGLVDTIGEGEAGVNCEICTDLHTTTRNTDS